MMTHDPFQNFQTIGAYSGGATPFGLPYPTPFQSFNPAAFAGQTQGHPGIGGLGAYPNPFQGVGFAPQFSPWQQPQGFNPLSAGNPFAAGLQNPLAAILQNPLLAAGLQQHAAQIPWQNPLTATLQNPLLNAMQAYHGWPQQQATPFGYPLAPQTLMGAGGIGQGFGQSPYGQSPFGQSPFGQGNPLGQINPLAQAALRSSAGYGISPLAGCF